MLPRFAVSPLPFNVGLFLEDFRQALSRCGTPHLPARMWHRCLAQADEFDTVRMLAARYAKIDAAEYFAPRVAYYERLCQHCQDERPPLEAGTPPRAKASAVPAAEWLQESRRLRAGCERYTSQTSSLVPPLTMKLRVIELERSTLESRYLSVRVFDSLSGRAF
jgi:hypothetical protein